MDVKYNGGATPVGKETVRYGPNLPGVKVPHLNWPLIIARFKYYGWIVCSKAFLAIVYLALVREGLRNLIPTLGTKLSSLPGLAFLDDFTLTYRMDLASAMAVFVMLAVFWLWDRVLSLWLHGVDTAFESDDPSFRVRRELLYYVLALAVFISDALLFYWALVNSGWDRPAISFSAMIVTVVYSAILIFFALATIDLRQKLALVTRGKHEKSQ